MINMVLQKLFIILIDVGCIYIYCLYIHFYCYVHKTERTTGTKCSSLFIGDEKLHCQTAAELASSPASSLHSSASSPAMAVTVATVTFLSLHQPTSNAIPILLPSIWLQSLQRHHVSLAGEVTPPSSREGKRSPKVQLRDNI